MLLKKMLSTTSVVIRSVRARSWKGTVVLAGKGGIHWWHSAVTLCATVSETMPRLAKANVVVDVDFWTHVEQFDGRG